MQLKNNVIILFSGGQDSTTCLFKAKTEFKKILALNINYRQRHTIELDSAERISFLAKVPYMKLDTTLFQDIGDSALIQSGDISNFHRGSNKLPSSFVPGRNVIFLTIAASLAYKYQIHDIITGVSQEDFSGYPDCREETIKSLQSTLSLALDFDIVIHTPLMNKNKKEIVEMAIGFPGCIEALSYSHTCYEGKQPPCGDCPACKLRAKGFNEAGIIDPLINRLKRIFK
jgi:7-cyano-7-deazaguanine synthase